MMEIGRRGGVGFAWTVMAIRSRQARPHERLDLMLARMEDHLFTAVVQQEALEVAKAVVDNPGDLAVVRLGSLVPVLALPLWALSRGSPPAPDGDGSTDSGHPPNAPTRSPISPT